VFDTAGIPAYVGIIEEREMEMTEAQKQAMIKKGFEDWTNLSAAEVRERIEAGKIIAQAKFKRAVAEYEAKRAKA
jgi:hypothetical protein